MYVCMYVCIYICMYVCMYACMYVCMYIYTYYQGLWAFPLWTEQARCSCSPQMRREATQKTSGQLRTDSSSRITPKSMCRVKTPFLSALSVCVRVRPSFLIYVPCSYMPFLTATMHRHLLSRHHLFHAGFAGRGDCGLRASSCQPHGASARSPCRCRLQVF